MPDEPDAPVAVPREGLGEREGSGGGAPKEKDMLSAYHPSEVEDKWYRLWEERGYFHDQPNPSRRPYSLVIPPPNVTGSLHMGHALNNSLQDFITRRRRMQGMATLWLPGTDHAGIATQNVVERKLQEQGRSRWEMGREAFLREVWAWKEKYGSTIIEQLKKLGCSCDWQRLRFTMDEDYCRAVRRVFVSLYREGLIYRDNYIINWCPRCRTALSDIEVEHLETDGHLWYIRYDLEEEEGFIEVATTRPETMLGDTAVAVSPGDERYRHLVGKRAVLPLLGRPLPIIADDFVDPLFGTGVVKVTPAHDPNDFEMGRRHGLAEVNILTPQAVINGEGGPYEGLDRYEARKAILRDLEEQGRLTQTESHRHAVGHCYRCRTVVEPYLSEQWFVRMRPLAEPAIRAVEEGRIRFVPERWVKVYFDWMYNIRDWCISRQLWWGHRIPAWYCRSCGETLVEEEDPPGCPCGGELEQDPDVLDTWFSSALWPFATLGWPEPTPDLRYYYPTSVLVTGFDIIFFWVARMIMNGLHFMGEVPFREVFITALIRDELGKKMSKSSGNVIDPLDVIEEFGCDALRFTLGHIAVPGRDIFLSRERIEGSRHFCNKIWNASRLVLMNLDGFLPAEEPYREGLRLEDRWILSRLAWLVEEVDGDFEAYDFSEACKALHDFFWSDFCDWYLEMAKMRLYGDDREARKVAQGVLWEVLETFLRLAHPIMPFLTEEIWQRLPHRGGSIMKAPWPEPRAIDRDAVAEKEMAWLQEVIGCVRRIRSELRIPPARQVPAFLLAGSRERREELENHLEHLLVLARLSSAQFIEAVEDPSGHARGVAEGVEIFIPLKEALETEEGFDAEVKRLRRELARLEEDASGARAKLSNPRFLERAPAEVVEKQRRKLHEIEEKAGKLRQQLQLLEEG